jgi:hypothetical protein
MSNLISQEVVTMKTKPTVKKKKVLCQLRQQGAFFLGRSLSQLSLPEHYLSWAVSAGVILAL